ncbi:MAG: hypothetical protein ACRD2E_02855 [Terriglobales bacterium]
MSAPGNASTAPSAPAATPAPGLAPHVRTAVERFCRWLEAYGETSYDFQTVYASPIGRRAKAFYYRNKRLGTLAVAPMVACEAFAPQLRRLFWKKQRFPIADAHFAMGFAFLAQATGEPRHLDRAAHFLQVLEATRCPAQAEYCWGYDFDWETIYGVILAGTPLITTTPYGYEAFSQVYALTGDARWRAVMESVARHAFSAYRDLETGPGAASSGYTPAPDDSCLVVNASAYRAFLLTKAGVELGEERYVTKAERYVNFVAQAQNPDGSWPYAKDGRRNFVDHFHTCFLMKALAKIEALTGSRTATAAIERGVAFYTENLFDAEGLPRPFARAPRFTFYRRELYDYAECINLAVLLRGRFPALDQRLSRVVQDILGRWQRPGGAFRSRQLLLGWDNVPMHRWAQAQLFRSLAMLLASG